MKQSSLFCLEELLVVMYHPCRSWQAGPNDLSDRSSTKGRPSTNLAGTLVVVLNAQLPNPNMPASYQDLASWQWEALLVLVFLDPALSYVARRSEKTSRVPLARQVHHQHRECWDRSVEEALVLEEEALVPMDEKVDGL